MKTDALLILDGANTKMSIRTPQGEIQQDDILRMRRTRTCKSKVALIRKPKGITNIVMKTLCSLRMYALLLQEHKWKYNQILLAGFVSNTWALRLGTFPLHRGGKSRPRTQQQITSKQSSGCKELPNLPSDESLRANNGTLGGCFMAMYTSEDKRVWTYLCASRIGGEPYPEHGGEEKK